jgi:hypothetical protein
MRWEGEAMESLWSGDIEWADATCGEVLSGSQSHHRQYHRRDCKNCKQVDKQIPPDHHPVLFIATALPHAVMHTQKERSLHTKQFEPHSSAWSASPLRWL